MEKMVTAFNVLDFYVGLEHFYIADEIGLPKEVKEISLYSQVAYIHSDKASRRKLVNMDTCDEIVIDQNGECIYSDSEYRGVIEITHLHSFKDCVKTLLQNAKSAVDKMENGKETNEWWESLDQLMDREEQLNEPVLMSFDAVENIIGAINNVFTLAYGNPLSNESKERVLIRFINLNNNHK